MCRSFESSLEPSLRRVTEPHANSRVPARVYDVEGGAIFAKNSTFVFFDGFAWTPRLRSPSPIMAPGVERVKHARERAKIPPSPLARRSDAAGDFRARSRVLIARLSLSREIARSL